MKRLLFIYNPNAGRQKAKAHLASFLEVFSNQGYLVTVFPTQGPGDAVRAAGTLGCNYDRVICCGGDGTINETVTGLMELPRGLRPILGCIPTGTVNDFARNLALPQGMDHMAQVACSGIPTACDLGTANGHWFTYVAAFGLFTDVSYATPQNFKNMLGQLAYLLEGASRLTSIRTYHMKVESPDTCVEGDFIYGMVGNTVSVGGLVKLPSDRVKLDDGQFEVLLVRKPKTPADYSNVIRALTTQSVPEDSPLVAFTASQVTFTCDEPLPWTVDGEFGGEHCVTHIENHRQTIVLACGPKE